MDESQYDRHRRNIRKVLSMAPEDLPPRDYVGSPRRLRMAHDEAAAIRAGGDVSQKAQDKERVQTMAAEAKAAKQTARDQGFPDVYLSEGGNFKPGKDARAKSDLIKSALGITDDSMEHKFTVDEAMALLQARNWVPFLTAKKESLEAKAAKAETAKAAKANGAAEASPETKAKLAEAAKTAVAEAEVTPDPKPSTRKKTTRRGGRIRS